MFTSGTQALQGRTVNHDPEPLEQRDGYGNICGRAPRYSRAAEGIVLVHDPRPEYAVHDNPILAAYRKQGWLNPEYAIGALYALDAFGGFSDWDDPEHPHHALTIATGEQVDHARRVLAKLAALES